MSENIVPEKITPSIDGIESRLIDFWQQEGVYDFAGGDEGKVFSIDTPPPTVSGSLHVGHVFSYTHTDAIARYKRMAGFDVFYPMGWDDNGLPTERRVQNYFGISCDPSLPYDPNLKPPENPDPKKFVPVSRQNFIELCIELTQKDEQAFEEMWRNLGLSVDWSLTYTTIGKESQRVSQLAFLNNLERGQAYVSEAPCLWDTSFQTAVAQAELEEREIEGAYYSLAFKLPDDGTLQIDTTRPELLPACVAVVAHPDDDRYENLFNSTVKTALFGVEVPILADRRADPEKGSGAVMVCTFGDMADVTWWRELNLPIRNVLDKNGRFLPEAPHGVEAEKYLPLAELTTKQAKKRILELLDESGELIGELRQITHPVKFFEKGDSPLEIITAWQWYITNGGRSEKLNNKLLEEGAKLNWVPDNMEVRFKNWVEGLNGDWLISRQRFFGVPFPIWYRLDENGVVDYNSPLTPDIESLPIDPATAVPEGYKEAQRSQPDGFIEDPDVMDTWATSSLTPFIACGWKRDPKLFKQTFPMSLRPQAHEIIRTWLFSTLLRSHLGGYTLPWENVSISGWVLDPDRKKMSKSKGNVVTPMDWIKKYGADALRYWACKGRPGTDTAFEENQIKAGRRLAIKILNAGKFVLGIGNGPMSKEELEGTKFTRLDASILGDLEGLITKCTAEFEVLDYARSLELTEKFFWRFTDDYIELLKARAYGKPTKAGIDPMEGFDDPKERKEMTQSARATLQICLENLLKLFAPFLPFVTEEVWQSFKKGSIHKSSWPQASEIARPERADTTVNLFALASILLEEYRTERSAKKMSPNDVIEYRCVKYGQGTNIDELSMRQTLNDIGATCSIKKLKGIETTSGDSFTF